VLHVVVQRAIYVTDLAEKETYRGQPLIMSTIFEFLRER